MVAKGISQDDFSENGVGRWSYNYTSEEPMYCFGRFFNTFASEGSPIFLPIFGSVFSRTTSFFLNDIFLIHGLGKCEGVGEDSRHENGHLDIQVGSRIYLSVCLHRIIAYALRWGVTYLG